MAAPDHVVAVPRVSLSRNAPAAQLDKALPSEGKGQKVESSRARHSTILHDFADTDLRPPPHTLSCTFKGREDSLLPKPIIQNGLVLHRLELGDPAEAHHLGFAERLVGQEFV
jgi:hypothetical protein